MGKYKGMSIAQFIELLQQYPQDAVIGCGNLYCMKRSQGQREEDHGIVADLDLDFIISNGTTESDKKLMFWCEE